MLKRWLSRFLTTTFATTMLLGNIVQAHAAEQSADIYLNPRASVEDRVNDLMSKMTLDDKIGQMVQAERKTATPADVKTYKLGSVLSGGGSLPTPNTAVGWADMIDEYQKSATSTELKIPILYGVDAVHGDNNVYGATIFPHNIGLGATGDTGLVKKVGQAVAEEVRATGVNWAFAPTLGIPHNERWGRTYETFGEDSELVAKMGEAYIEGLQGEDPSKTLKRNDKVIATAKHYIGEGLTENGTNQGNVVMSDEDFQKALKDELLAPYKAAVDAGVRSVMVSYNSVNGVKCHGNADLITKVLKQDLGFKGIVISDYEGIKQISGTGITTQKDKIAVAINAGIDMAMEPNDWKGFMTSLKELVNEGKVPQTRIDDAVTRILTVKFEMGLFEDPYAQRDLLDTVGSKENREVARQAVRESLVLLKNDNDIVGQLKNKKNILVAGKSADDIGLQSGGWTISWQGSAGNITPGTTILQGIKNTVGSDVKVTYNKRGRAAADNDVAVVVIGETPYAETDGDRTPDKLTLDSDDLLTLKNIKETNPNLPVVAVLVTGRPITIADQVQDFDGLVEAWLPGTEGQGVADVLFGSYDFTGKLTMTWPWYAEDITTKHDDGKALFNYGFGLKKGENKELPAKPVKQDKPSIPVPGKIETEAYSTQSGFQFETTQDVGGGQNAGYTDAGDWLDYYVNVAEDAKYEVEFRVASPGGSTGGVELLLGSKLLTKLDVPDTTNWQNWTSVKGTVNLKAGKQTLRFRAGSGNFNFNYMNFVKVGPYEAEPEDPPVTYNPQGQVIEKGAVDVYMSSSEESGSMSWYDSPKEISNKLSKKDNIDITSPDGQQATTINVDSSKTYQTFLGMGTSLEESSVNNIAKMSKEKRTEFLTNLLDPEKGAGMSLLRVTIGTPDFTAQDFYTYYDKVEDPSNPDWYNTTGKGFSIQKDIDYKIVDTIKEALAINPNVKLFASSWTPPGWMKLPTSNSKSYENNDLLLKGGTLNDDYIDDLAKYYVRYMEEYAKLGIPMYAMTLQNEPELEINYPSCKMTSEQERKLAIDIKAEVAKSSILKAKNVDPKVWAFDHNFSSSVNYVSPILNDSEGNAAVDGVAFHDYGGEPTAMTQVHNLFPSKSMNLTERAVWGTKGADRIAQYFRNYAESYTSWVTMLDSNIAPEQWTGTPDPTMLVQDANDRENYWATPEFYISGQFSKFIRPGAVRIDSNYGSADTVTNVAFKNTDGSIVMVVINQTDKDQKFKALSDGIQIGGVVPAKNVATYKWNPVQNIAKVPSTILAKNFTAKNNANVVEDGADGSHVGGMSTGSWLDYTVDVKEPGLYNVKFLAASGTWTENGIEQNLIKGVKVTQGDVVLGETSITNAGWNNYKDNSTTVKFEKAGIQKIRLNVTGAFDLRTIKFEKVKEIHNLPGRIEAEAFTNANGIVVENNAIGYLDKDDFVSYKVNVAEAGVYDLNMLISSGTANPEFDVYSNDIKLGTISLASTGDWANWKLTNASINLPAGEQTLKFVVKQGFNLDYFTVGSSIKLTSTDITENSLNGKVINVELSNGTFVDTLNNSNWVLSNLPAGVTYNVDRIDATHAKITLSGERNVDFDLDKTVTVAMAAKELVGGDAKTYSITDDFVIVANNDAEELTTDSNIAINTNEFIVTLNGGTFVQDKVNTITLSGDIITNGNVKLSSVEYIDSTHVKVKLTGWKTYYEDLILTVNVPASAYSDSIGNTVLTKDVTCVKSDLLPTPNVIGNTAVTLTEANAYRTKGSLASNVVSGNRVDYYLNVAEAGEYTLTYTGKNNASIANAIKVSKGSGINIAGNLVTYNLGNFYNATNSFKDTITLEAGLQTLRFEAVNTGFTLSSIKIEKKAQPQVISGTLGDKSTVVADSFYKGSNDKGYAIETKNNIKNIGCTVAGTYLDYSVNVAEAGKYKVNFNYATTVSGAVAVLQTGSGKELGRLPLTSTGDWGKFVDTTTPIYVTLDKGVQTIRVYVDGDGYNYRSLTFEPVKDSGAPELTGKDGAIEKGSNADLLKALSIVAIDDLDGDITSKVVIDSSKVDFNTVGEYEVKASVTDDSGNQTEKTFKLTIREDGTAPVIEGHNAIIAVGSKFDPIADLGLKVTDNKDGNMTSNAQITHVVDTSTDGVFRVKVSATDKAGNSSERIFIVRVISQGVIDTADVTLTVGDSFDPLTGVKAYDLNGEYITSKIIIVSNNVDTSKAGTYKVVYKITDRENTVITKERVVTVKDKPADPGNGEGNNPGNGGNPTPGDNGSNPTTSIITDENGNKVVVVNKINNKDGKNIIEVPNGQKGVFVEISDIESIMNGTGSLEIKNDSSTITLPFSAIDKSLLTTGSKVVLNLTLEEGSDLTKHIKGLSRVFNFNLFVVNGDKKVQIHNFAKGEAEVSLTLSDSEIKSLNMNNIGVFYYNESTGKFELMNTRVDGNKVIFNTKHFSKFIVAEVAQSSNGVLPKTGSDINTNNIIFLGMIMLLSGAFLVRRRKKDLEA
ncbi:glycoside hydrolase family 3 N-terminal domain-containing protein [Clostridium sp. YIM B02551]|uniref:glycoside hydrolase family 3 N-terminal domain-containing protein n=1 Tax=Clostridium sp. YIM B02551 TaxID=2910679 RepID=UPI001EEC4E63|nr:glycoside hydrolase family 3 N-terminal domain-containing protein [Clostridium sp. YIM B02551]